MIGIRTRRSIVFQLWVRLSAITVVFALLAVALYVWVAISDRIGEAHDDAERRAGAVLTAVVRLSTTGNPPSYQELAIAQALGVESIEILNSDSTVARAFADAGGRPAAGPLRMDGDTVAVEQGYEAKAVGNAYVRHDISPMDLLGGGEYGAVFVYPLPGDTGLNAVRIVLSYGDLAGAAQTLLLRTIVLTGAILAVLVTTLWMSLDRLIARPLQAYSATAHRIAAGEPLRMPDTGNNELGQLGRAINGMADILRHQATIDALTGLYNLQHLTSCLEGLVDEARARNEPLALLVCDLDNLKPVNDTYGHHVGDMLLKAVAHELLMWSGVEYTCWRTGGDEFAALIPGAGHERALREAEVLEKKINSTTIAIQSGEVPLSVSIGVATYPADGATGAALINIADLRMYDAKSKKGKPRATADAA